MRTDAEIAADARPGRAFSNHTQWEIWAARWCYRCANDDDETETYCPVLTVALSGSIPLEWSADAADTRVHGDYVCTEFDQGWACERCGADGMSSAGLVAHLAKRHTEEPAGPPPGPPPELPGQEALF